jgi:hypothetical protein
MLIKLETERRRGLRIIEEIPDIELCKIQGYNGIGKTNAIKLLALCSGETPFRGDPAAWPSFREQLLAGTVRVSGLRDGEEIVWELTPEQWPADPKESLGESIGSMWINGKKASLGDVRQIFRVYHILAAETPQNVLSARVLEAQKEISAWNSERQKRLDAIDESIDRVSSLIVEAGPEKLSSEIVAARDALDRAKKVATELEEASHRMALLKRAAEVSDHLIQVRGRGPEMDAKLAELAERLSVLEREKESLDQKIADASARKHRDAEAEKYFKNSQAYLARHDRALSSARTALENAAAAAGIEPRRDVIEQAHREAGERLTELTSQLPSVHAAPLILEVLDDLIHRLNAAQDEDLGSATLLTDSEGTEIYSVLSLNRAFMAERENLRKRTPSADAAKLNEAISRTRNLLDSLARTSDALSNFELAEAGLVKAKKRLQDAVDGLPEQTARTLDELMESRNQLDRESAQVQTNHARLSHARELLGGGLDEQSLNSELVTLCQALGVKASRVKGQLSIETAKLEEIVRSNVQASQQAERASLAVERRSSAVKDVLLQLSQDDSNHWLFKSRPHLAELVQADAERQASALVDVLRDVERAGNRLHRIDSTVRGTGQALSELHASLGRGDGLPEGAEPLDHAVRLWLREDVRKWFDDELVRKALFGGGSDIRLDPRDMTICWTNEDGEEERRPLSAFSSGQQVFAYTQAQVAKLDREGLPAANRLIALDEFGSFLDWDRMSRLVDYLQSRERGATRDQVLVVLPLEEDAPRRRGEASVVQQQVRSLEQRGYFAEELRT